MTTFLYTDTNGQKHQIDDQQIRELVAHGLITPHTPLETTGGHKGLAGQIPGLFTVPVPPSIPTGQTVPPVKNNPSPPIENAHATSNRKWWFALIISVLLLWWFQLLWYFLGLIAFIALIFILFYEIYVVKGDSKITTQRVVVRLLGLLLLFGLIFFVNSGYKSHYADIFEAIGYGTVDDVRYFVEKKWVSVNVKCNNDCYSSIGVSRGETPLHAALLRENRFNLPDPGAVRMDIITYLIKKGANVNAKNDQGKTPLHLAASIIDSTVGNNNSTIDNKIIKLLIENGAKVNTSDNDGNSPLHCAYYADGSQSERVKYLIANGADVNAKNNAGHIASYMVIEKEKSRASIHAAWESTARASESREYDLDGMNARLEQSRREAQERRDDNQRRMDILQGKPGTTRIVPY